MSHLFPQTCWALLPSVSPALFSSPKLSSIFMVRTLGSLYLLLRSDG